jgi:excisionase family DNA binding protein
VVEHAIYLTVREVAELARCEHKAVRRAITSGRLRAFRPTNRILIRQDDARTWIEGRPAAIAPSQPQPARAAPLTHRAVQSQHHSSVADLKEIERKMVRA